MQSCTGIYVHGRREDANDGLYVTGACLIYTYELFTAGTEQGPEHKAVISLRPYTAWLNNHAWRISWVGAIPETVTDR